MSDIKAKRPARKKKSVLPMPGASDATLMEAKSQSMSQSALVTVQSLLRCLEELPSIPPEKLSEVKDMAGGDAGNAVKSALSILGLSGAQTMTQVLHGGRLVRFDRVVVPHNEIESRTRVSPLNPRVDTPLTINDVKDILSTLDAHENSALTQVAFGYYDHDRVISAVDGRRRRFACLQCKNSKPDFTIWVTEETLTIEDANILDEIMESALKKTAVEAGRFWLKLIDERGIDKTDKDEMTQFAETLGVSESTFKRNLRLAKVRPEVLELAYAPSHLGYSLLNKLLTIDEELDNVQLETLTSSREQFVATHAGKLSKSSPNNANKEVVDFLSKEMLKIIGDDKPTEKFEDVARPANRRLKLQRRTKFVETSKTYSVEYAMKGLSKGAAQLLQGKIDDLLREFARDK